MHIKMYLFFIGFYFLIVFNYLLHLQIFIETIVKWSTYLCHILALRNHLYTPNTFPVRYHSDILDSFVGKEQSSSHHNVLVCDILKCEKMDTQRELFFLNIVNQMNISSHFILHKSIARKSVSKIVYIVYLPYISTSHKLLVSAVYNRRQTKLA